MPSYLKDESPDTVLLVILGVINLTAFIFVIIGCVWCRVKWKQLFQGHARFSGSSQDTSLPVQNLTEFIIFPPQSGNPLALSQDVNTDEVVFEPLPEIRSRGLTSILHNVRPARFTVSYRKISLQDWFDEHQVNFPRNQLKYLKEVGASWFGQAVEGEAFSIIPKEDKTKVVVKILRVDASATEHMQYLQETRPFRDLRHPNLLRLLGRCLEVHPFLLIMEHCSMDLKACLIEQRKLPETLLKDGLILRMTCNIAAGLQHMHEHDFVHTDIAARSCLVMPDFTVKIGDYGTAVHLHRGDFYCLGDVAFPIRWCSPESLLCTHNMIEAKDITKEANIWSLGVLLWELLEFGKLPYFDVCDEDVIQRVLMDCSLKLDQPKIPCVHNDMIYKVMQLCWLPPSHRPTIQKVAVLLNYLYDNKDVLPESSPFESRWNTLQPVLREHNLTNHVANNLTLRFESDFIAKKQKDISRDCDSVLSSDFDRNQYGDKSPSCGSFSIDSEGYLGTDMSPSLLNLRGSVEDLIGDHSDAKGSQADDASDSTSQNSALQTSIVDSDITQFHITQAIKDLDEVLAEEVTSSEASNRTTPEELVHEDTSSNHTLNSTTVNGNVEKAALNCNLTNNLATAVAIENAMLEQHSQPESISCKESLSNNKSNSVSIALFNEEE